MGIGAPPFALRRMAAARILPLRRCVVCGQLVLLLLLGFGCKPTGVTQTATKPSVPRNETAERFFAEGEGHMRARSYGDAAIAFDNVILQPPNQRTTAGFYLAGLAYTYQRDYEKAISRFQELLKKYPASRYADEATYHKAYILLRNETDAPGGLYVLLNLIEQTDNSGLRTDAEALLRRYFYEQASIEFLKDYYARVRPSYKAYTLEALAYRLYREGRATELGVYLDNYEANHGALTERLQRFRRPGTGKDLTELRISLVLPFAASRTDTTIGRVSRVALQLYEGMRYALNTGTFPVFKDVKLQVLDSEDDPETIRRLVREDIVPFRPHLVIGDVRNAASTALAQALAEENIPQVVPLSDDDGLLEAAPQVLLLNPSAETCARAQARYAMEQLNMKSFAVVYEGTTESSALADAFADEVVARGGTCRRQLLPFSPSDAQAPVASFSKQLELNPVDAVYVPVSNQELASVTLYQFSRDSIPLTQIFAPERWRTFRSMDRELLYRFNVIVTDAYEPGLDAEAEQAFTTGYYQQFGAPPSAFAAQGYDLIRYLLTALSQHPEAGSLGAALGETPVFRGLRQSFYVGGARTNQSVQLLRFTPEGVERLASWRPPNDR